MTLINRFIEATESNNFEKANKIYYHLNNSSRETALYDAFLKAISTKNLNTVIWLYDMDMSYTPRTLTPEKMSYLFSRVCHTSNIDVAIFLLNTGMVDPHYNQDNPFRMACYYNQIIMAKWMYENIENINIRAKDDEAFKIALKHKHVDILKFLTNTCYFYKVDMIDSTIFGYKIDDIYYNYD